VSILIGITQRIDKVNAYDEWRDSVDQRLVEWVIDAGFIPIPIPNNLVNSSSESCGHPFLEQWLSLLNINALLLSGGNDIGTVAQRDVTEKFLLKWAEKHNKPVLGICRGMQMMGLHVGGKLIKVSGHVNTRHKLQYDKFSKIKTLESVNSYHNYALEGCPDVFSILAKSDDGNIEAIRHRELPWEAWMWHPEREDGFLISHLERFKRLINNGK
jgi:N5-(cytidine 5'-diphosphoramidyl)-L-glutamine hydrolase